MVRLKFDVPPDADSVEFPGGLHLPATVVVSSEDHEGYGIEARVTYDGTRYVCADFRMWQREGGPPVTTEAIRAVPVKHLIRRAIESQTYELVQWSRGQEPKYELMPELAPPDVRRSGADEMARWVATAYQLAIALNEPPTKSIQDRLGVSRATAGRWVAEARRQGLLPPPGADDDGDR
jgi:hypothetical protein